MPPLHLAWTVRGRVFDPAGSPACRQAAPFCVWGIVNVTPDSFSDGGLRAGPDEAVAHARKLAEEGAAVLDIGGASSRPGAEDVPVTEELLRVLPVLTALSSVLGADALGSGLGTDALPPVSSRRLPLVSVDTWRAEVAAAVLAAGADVINDISACVWEPALLDVLAEYRPGYVLMHSQGRPGNMQAAPRYGDVVDDVLAFWEERMTALVRAGLPESNIMLDPGIGFGKNAEHNAALLAGVDRLLTLGRPLLLGLSRKSFFQDALGLALPDRDEATRICAALAAARGVMHHRVHEVAAACRALALARIMGGDGDRPGAGSEQRFLA